MDFKEIIKFSTEDYKTESNTGWFMDTFHLILWGSGWLLMGFVFFLAFLHTATRGFGDWDALLGIIGIMIMFFWFWKSLMCGSNVKNSFNLLYGYNSADTILE